MSVRLGRLAPVLLITLASCSADLPGSVWRGGPGERGYSAEAAIPIMDLIRQRDISTPDATAPVPLLEQVRRELRKSDATGRFAGVTYDLTSGNQLGSGWLLQSPARWGRRAADLPFYRMDCKDCEPDVLLPACRSDADCNGGTCRPIWPSPVAPSTGRNVCFGHSDALLLSVHDLVASARRSVDIAVLQPVPGTRFLAALRAGLAVLARSGRPIAVRLLVGQYPPEGADAAALLSSLTSGIAANPDARLTVSVAAMSSCTFDEPCKTFSWSHAKLIVVDGSEVLAGGHNLWSEDYFVDQPVHDLSLRLRGPAGASATRFADQLWQFVCTNLNKKTAVQFASFVSAGEGPATCPSSLGTGAFPITAVGDIPILAVGRMGVGITKEFANQSELARDLIFGAARRTIRMSQQDIGFAFGRSDTLFPDSTLERLIDFIEQRDGHVYIVLSNRGASGNSGLSYANEVTFAALARHLRDLVQKRVDARDPKARYEIRRGPDPVNAMLCSHVHLAPLRFGPDSTWPHGRAIANHAKLWMVDDRVFYVGSDNAYPVNLQEFGYIVDDRKAAAELLDAYWNPLWQWSGAAALSGEGVEHCIFRQPP